MSTQPKNGRRSSATLRASSKAQRARKRKVLKRDAARQERIRIAFEGFKVSAAAQAMAGLDAATFFERLDSYPRFARSYAMERRGRRDLFVGIYELILGLGERINSPEFIAIAKQQAQALRGANMHPAAVILRRGMRYEDRWLGLQEQDQAAAKKSALKLASQDFAALRHILSKGYPVAEVRRRMALPGDGIKAWEKAWRRRNDAAEAGEARGMPGARRAKQQAKPPRPFRPYGPDIEWLVGEILAALRNQLPLDFTVDFENGCLVYVQFEKDALGGLRIVGARRLGAASRFSTKAGAKHLRRELQAVKRPLSSARRSD